MDHPAPPWKRAGVQQRSLRQERRNGALPGGSRQPGSGRYWNRKRDNILDNLLVETRFSDSGRYCIEEPEWAKIEREAQQTPNDGGIGCQPGMQIDLTEHKLLLVNLQTHLDAKVETQYLREYIAELEEEIERLRDAGA